MDLPFGQAAGHFIVSALNPQRQSAVTKTISFHLFSVLQAGGSDGAELSRRRGEAKNGGRGSESTMK